MECWGQTGLHKWLQPPQRSTLSRLASTLPRPAPPRSTSCSQIAAPPPPPASHRGASEAPPWSSLPPPFPSFIESFIIISFFLCFFSNCIHFYHVSEICPMQKTWKKNKGEGGREGRRKRRKPSTTLSIKGNYLPLCFDTQIYDIRMMASIYLQCVYIYTYTYIWGFSSDTGGKEPSSQCRRLKRLGFELL